MISLRYSLTPQDFIAYFKFVQLEAPGKKKAIYKTYLPILLVFSFIILLNIITSIFNGKIDYTIFITIFVFVLIFFAIKFGIKSKINKLGSAYAANSENASLFNMTDYIFSETGVFVKDDIKETKFKWAAFIKIIETDGYYYLFVHSTNGLIIPKKVFRSQVEKEKFQQLLSQYISVEAELSHLIKQ